MVAVAVIVGAVRSTPSGSGVEESAAMRYGEGLGAFGDIRSSLLVLIGDGCTAVAALSGREAWPCR